MVELQRIWSRAVGRTAFLNVGYARVSTKKQSLDAQLHALRLAGCDTIYADKARGGNVDREGLAAAVRKCRPGDQLVVWRLDRLGRRLVHLVSTVEQLSQRGINVCVLNGRGTHADFSHPEGRFVLAILAGLAQLEDEVISTRTKNALLVKSVLGRHALPAVSGRDHDFLLRQFQWAARYRGQFAKSR